MEATFFFGALVGFLVDFVPKFVIDFFADVATGRFAAGLVVLVADNFALRVLFVVVLPSAAVAYERQLESRDWFWVRDALWLMSTQLMRKRAPFVD